MSKPVPRLNAVLLVLYPLSVSLSIVDDESEVNKDLPEYLKSGLFTVNSPLIELSVRLSDEDNFIPFPKKLFSLTANPNVPPSDPTQHQPIFLLLVFPHSYINNFG